MLSQLGAGGMGVVYAAYDPELDRKVAVKLLHPRLAGSVEGERARGRLLREAQALARLSHPNVVAVYDVGTYQEQVFIAMEFVRGASLAAWLRVRPRRTAEVLAVFQDAGRGLAAAHREGLVHGDFKPENVLIGDDGRVRVVDFGLSFAQDAGVPEDEDADEDEVFEDEGARAGRRRGFLRGTPAYLSPEQFQGEPGTARADQFSFCVSLFEGLYGERPFAGDDLSSLARTICVGEIPPEPPGRRLPGWLRRVVLRGLSTQASARFATMDELLAALARDPTRRRRRIVAGVALAAALAGAAYVYRWYLVRAYEARQGLCAAASSRLAGVWDPDRRDRVRAAILATAVPYAADAAERVELGLDRVAAAWVDMHTEACEATHLRGEQSTALLDLRMACLQRRLAEVGSLVEVLMDADAEVVERAAEAVARLPGLGTCADAAALLAGATSRTPAQTEALARVRDTLARARALELTARHAAGLAIVDGAEAEARGLGDRGLLAEVALQRGSLQASAADPAALVTLTEAFFTAESTAAEGITAHAAIELAHEAVRRVDLTAAAAWLRHAEAFLRRLGDAGAPELVTLRISFLNVRGTMRAHAGEHAAAEEAYREALALASGVHRRADLHNNLGNVLVRRGAYDAAAAELERAVSLYRDSVGSRHPSLGIALNNLAEVSTRRRDWQAARSAYTQAGAILRDALGADHPNVGVVDNNLGDVALRLGELAAAAEHYTRARQVLARALGEDAAPLAYPLTGIGEVYLAQARPDEARQTLERALALRDLGDHAALARTRFALARALAAVDPGRARELAEQARDAYREAGEVHALERAEVEAWLGASQPAPPRG